MLLLVQGLFSYSTKLNFVRDTVAIFDNSPIIEDRFLVTKEFRYQLLLLYVHRRRALLQLIEPSRLPGHVFSYFN